MPEIQELGKVEATDEAKTLVEIEKALEGAEFDEFFESTTDFDPREFAMRRY